MFTPPAASDDRQAFYRRIDQHNLTPLWEVLGALVPHEPTSPCVPALWRSDLVRGFLLESGSLISAREAERRVLVLENPGLRVVLEGEGAYTAVDGERVTMHPGDFIVTPSWTFHDHGNPGNDPVVWLDGLDIPIVAFFDAGFAERYQDEVQPVAKREGDALARYGTALLPLDYASQSHTTPVFCYPYARSREAL